MPDSRDARTLLPIPDAPRTGPITYDAKDPESTFPPIEVEIAIAEAADIADHIVDPEEVVRVAMARQ